MRLRASAAGREGRGKPVSLGALTGVLRDVRDRPPFEPLLPDPRTPERVLLAIAVGGLALGCFLVLRPFAAAIAWAVVLVFCSWPVFEGLRRSWLRSPGAALLIILGFALFAALPLALIVPGGGSDLARLNAFVGSMLAAGLPNAPLWVYRLPVGGPALADLWNSWAADLSRMVAFFRPYLGAAAAEGLSLLLDVAHALAVIGLALFIGFFLFLSGDVLQARLRAIARRIGGHAGERMLLHMGRTVRGTMYALLGTALVQGVLTGIGLSIAGIGRAPLLALIAGFISVLPIGPPLVWGPAGLWLLASGATDRGIFLLVYGVVVVSGADHVLRPWLISKGSQLPFVVTVLGVLGGVLAFGLIGILAGPMLLGAGFVVLKDFAAEPAGPERLGPRRSAAE